MPGCLPADSSPAPTPRFRTRTHSAEQAAELREHLAQRRGLNPDRSSLEDRNQWIERRIETLGTAETERTDPGRRDRCRSRRPSARPRFLSPGPGDRRRHQGKPKAGQSCLQRYSSSTRHTGPGVRRERIDSPKMRSDARHQAPGHRRGHRADIRRIAGDRYVRQRSVRGARPRPTINTLGMNGDKPVVQIQGAQVDKTSGNLNLTTVSVVDGMSLFDSIGKWISGDYTLSPRDGCFRRPDSRTGPQGQSAGHDRLRGQRDARRAAASESATRTDRRGRGRRRARRGNPAQERRAAERRR